MTYESRKKKISSFTVDDALTDSSTFDFIKNGTNKKTSWGNILDKFSEVYGLGARIFETQADLVASDIQIDEHAIVVSNNYGLYKITSLAAGAQDVTLTSGFVATLQNALDVPAPADYTELRAIETAGLLDGTPITVTNSGIAGDFVLVNSVAHGLTDNGGTIIVINSNWYARRIFDGAVSVLWFVTNNTDGIDDNSAAFQAACDYWDNNPTAGGSGGGVYAPGGPGRAYSVQECLIKRQGTRIYGDGRFNTEVRARGGRFVFGTGNLEFTGNFSVSNISATNPAVVTTSSAHGLSNQDMVYMQSTGVAGIDNFYWEVTNVTSTTFEIQVSGSGWSSGGAVRPITETSVNEITIEGLAILFYNNLTDSSQSGAITLFYSFGNVLRDLHISRSSGTEAHNGFGLFLGDGNFTTEVGKCSIDRVKMETIGASSARMTTGVFIGCEFNKVSMSNVDDIDFIACANQGFTPASHPLTRFSASNCKNINIFGGDIESDLANDIAHDVSNTDGYNIIGVAMIGYNPPSGGTYLSLNNAVNITSRGCTFLSPSSPTYNYVTRSGTNKRLILEDRNYNQNTSVGESERTGRSIFATEENPLVDTSTLGADSVLVAMSRGFTTLNIISANNSSGLIKFGDQDNLSIGEINYSHVDDGMSFKTGGATTFRIDTNNTAGSTRMLIYDVDNATLERVTVGVADSGGAGFKVLRIPN